jgi:purine-binding chemotaxis protein CheW
MMDTSANLSHNSFDDREQNGPADAAGISVPGTREQELEGAVAALRREVEEKTKKLDKLKRYIANLEADGDRLNKALVFANSYKEAMDFNIIGIPMIMVSPSFELVKANKAFLEVAGFDPEVLQEKPKCSEVLKCESFRKGRCILREAFDSKQVVHGHQCSYVNPNGRKFKLTIDASPILDLATGEVLGGIEVFSKAEEDTRGKYLIFVVAGQEMGANVSNLKEIIPMVDVRPLPNMPDYVRGVVNLRGKVLPVLELRKKLGLVNGHEAEHPCVAIFELRRGVDRKTCGFIVDEIKGIVDLNSKDIEAMPEVGSAHKGTCIQGIAKVQNQSRVLIDVESLLWGDAMNFGRS